MRLRDGKYECAHCGTVLDVAPGEVPEFVITAVSGEPNMRVLFLHHREIHRCIIVDGSTSATVEWESGPERASASHAPGAAERSAFVLEARDRGD